MSVSSGLWGTTLITTKVYVDLRRQAGGTYVDIGLGLAVLHHRGEELHLGVGQSGATTRSGLLASHLHDLFCRLVVSLEV